MNEEDPNLPGAIPGREDKKAGVNRLFRKIAIIALVFIPLWALLRMTIGAYLGMNFLGLYFSQQFEDDRFQLQHHLTTVFLERFTYPLEELGAASLPVKSSEAARIVKRCPEIIAVDRISPDGAAANLFNDTPTVEAHQNIVETALAIKDTLPFNRAYWDTTQWFLLSPVEVEGRELMFHWLKREGSLYLLTVAPERLKAVLPDIISRYQRSHPSEFASHFPPYGHSAELKFYDNTGENFYTLGAPEGGAWGEMYDSTPRFLPWRVTIRIFTGGSREQMLEAAKTPEENYILFAYSGIAAVCVIFLAVFAPKLRGFVRREG